MGIRYEWGDKQELILNFYIEYPWTWAEYHEKIDEMMPILADLGRPCASVVDCTNLRSLPKDSQFLTVLMNTQKRMPDNLFASAVVAAPYIVTVFLNMLTQLRPDAERLMLFAHTQEEAYTKIYARYNELYSGSDQV